jgi:hypothetical protein
VYVWAYQSTANYASILYQLPQPISGQQYLSVIRDEFEMRNTVCYLDDVSSTVRGALGFLSLF